MTAFDVAAWSSETAEAVVAPGARLVSQKKKNAKN
jgi:hypothetical protein